MTKNKKLLWIAWEDDGSIRSRVLAREMKAEYYAFTLFEASGYLSVFRYPAAILQTFFTLTKERPKVLVVQNPSVVLAFFSALMKPVFNYKFSIDLHSFYIHPKGFKKIIMNTFNNYSLKQADIVIVTNEDYKDKIKNKANREIFILPDKIPDFDYDFKKTVLKEKNNILFICTFSEDEPWEEVINSSKLLDKDICIYISGRNKLNKKNVPSNVVLTGFIPSNDYQNLLRSVDIIMVLTTEEATLVCGAYESVSAEKPLILSDTKVLREYFSKGAIFTKNNSENIADSINLAIKNEAVLKREIKNLKGIRNSEWKKTWNNLLKKIFV